MRSLLARRLVDRFMSAVFVACTVLALIPLFSVLAYVGLKGVKALNLDFFTRLPQPVGEPGGGMANAIVGSLTLIGLAAAWGLPVGVGAGIYLAEFGQGRVARAVRFVAEVLNGIPSITVGIFVYAVVVMSMRRFSALAGGVALGIIMIPIVTRTTEEMLRMVPQSLREASLALGASRGRTVFSVVLRSAVGGLVTAVMLAVARVAGETAPLLFTALNNRFWHTGLDQPIASLPVQIFTYAISPFEDWQAQAWAGALVLTGMILVMNVAARVYAGRRMGR